MLAQDLCKPVIKKFKRRKVYARLKGNVWVADLAKMGSLYSFTLGIKCLLSVVDVFTKYILVKPLMSKKTKTFSYGFIEIVNNSRSIKHI